METEIKESIKEQLKIYFRTIHYNKVLKKQMLKLNILMTKRIKENNKLVNRLKELQEIKTEKIAEIKSITKEDDNKVIWIHTKKMYQNKLTPKSIKKIMQKLFHFDGYILYGNKANDFSMMKVKDLSMILNLVKKKESYNMVDKIGTINNKPLFIIKYPYAISLKIDDEMQDLYYDPKAYYQYVNHATRLNLLSKESENTLGSFVKNNLIIIIIIIGVAIFLSTPQGQKFISDLVQQFKG